MLRPLEKNKTNKFFYLKILSLLFLIGASLYGNYYFYNKAKQKPEVLSATKKNKKNNLSIDSILNEGKKTVEDLKQKGQEFGGQVLSVMEEKANQIASQSAKTVSDFVFDSTLGNILKQIEKLPKEQREKIKEEICR
jgi:predicted transcriptional regulator